MTSQPTPTTTTTYQKYAGPPPQNYERYFVPTIGVPSARRVLEAATLRKGERVLDVACGTGVAARLAAEAVGPTGSVEGVDANAGMLQVARTATPPGTSIEWHQGTAEALPLPDESFDAVLCSISLQFFTDKVGALREMRRVLAPAGRAVIGTPGPIPPPFKAMEDALTEHVGREASMFLTAVFSVHDPAQARDMLGAAGFDDIDVESRILPLRLPPPADFFWQYVQSTPLSAIAAELDADTMAALEQDVVERCRPFMDDGALVAEPGLLVATARRAR